MNSRFAQYVYVSFIAFAALMTGCAPSKTTPAPEEIAPAAVSNVTVSDLSVEPGDQRMTIQWERQGDGLISGYNIYISENSHLSDTMTPFNFAPYPGDTNPDDGVETFEAERLENGKKYYVTVRVIRPDRSLSAPANQASTICGPRGEASIEVRYSGEQDGLSLGTGKYVRAHSRENDLYFYTSEGKNFLSSPDKLDGYNRKSAFAKLSLKGSLPEIRASLAKLKVKPDAERIEVKVNEWILLRTADNRNAILHILAFEGKGKASKIRFEFAYCPAEGEMIF